MSPKPSTLVILIVMFTLSLGACSSKSKSEAPAPVTSEATEKPRVPRFLFTEIHILAETKPETSCDESQRLLGEHQKPFEIELTTTKRLSTSQRLNRLSANLDIEMIGYDSARYGQSIIDPVLPAQFPFSLSLTRLQGSALQLNYLDQVITVRLSGAPVYSFSAKEVRGECVILHNVNVFTENGGFYELEGAN